jgi:hypothetical protein
MLVSFWNSTLYLVLHLDSAGFIGWTLKIMAQNHGTASGLLGLRHSH